MIKKLNMLVLLLVILLSIGVVSASEDVNITDDNSNADILEVSDMDDSVSDGEPVSHTITKDNYGNYFDKNGNLINSSLNSGDTIYLKGSFSNLNFTIDKKVNIEGTSSNLKNSRITLLSGASRSSISNLNIANTKDETYGIFLNSASYCTIRDCSIVNNAKYAYAICIANGANYNNITDNYLKESGVTYGHNQRSTPALLVSGSDYNYLANNRVEVDDANGIYLSSYAGGPLKGGLSNHNTIYNNTIHYNVLPTSWSYGIQVMGKNNVIRQNTIIGGYRGVSTSEIGNTIVDNMIVNITGADFNHPDVESGGEYGIVASYNSYVANNTITGAKLISTGAGITAIDNSIVENNFVNVSLKGRGIVAGGSNVIIRNNVIYTASGSGIYQKGEDTGLYVDGNNITSVSGVGILIEKESLKKMPKNVTVVNNIISTGNKYAIDASDVQADTSNIDEFSNKGGLINSPAGVIDNSKPIYVYKGTNHTITPENIRTYINDNGGLTSEIKDYDILNFEGVFNDEIIYVTKAVKITGKNPIFYNSTFKITSGSVLIENLTIINKEANRVNAWGIFANQASGVKISNNKISVSDPKAAYAIYVLQSNYIEVINNELASEGDYLTFTLLSYACEDCIFENNTIKTTGTGEAYKFTPERCIDGNELVINGKSYCLDGETLVIDGKSYCLDGETLVIDGKSYCLDGNEFTIDGVKYCIDGNEFVIDGKSYCLDGGEFSIGGIKYCIDGNEFVIDGKSYCLDGNEFSIDGVKYCIDGNEFLIDGKSYCLDGNELSIDKVKYQFKDNKLTINGTEYCLDGEALIIGGTSYCLDGNELTIGGKVYCLDAGELVIDGTHYSLKGKYLTIGDNVYCLDGNELVINGKSYCLDGGELVIDGKTYCLDGNELVIDGTSYCVDGSEYCMDGAHVVSEIYQTYGILLLYSSNNVVSGNDVNVTSKLAEQQSTKGNSSSQNSIVGIDLYYNCHNNTVSNNKIFVKGNDNYIYGTGVLGYFTGHNAPGGKGATNNSFISNHIALEGVYCVEGIIIGDESEDTIIENNVLNLKSDAVVYGIYFELSQKSKAKGNNLTLDSQAIYGIVGFNSNDNVLLDNTVVANAKAAYGVIFSNGNNIVISGNTIAANGNGDEISVPILDSMAPGNAGIYLIANSTNNKINDNVIKSTKGYAIILDDSAVDNVVVDNYLESEKGDSNNAISNSENNNVSDNYNKIAKPEVEDVAVAYMGTGEFKLTFDKDMDGAVVKFYDVDGDCFAQSTVSNGVAAVNYKFDSSYGPAQYLFSAKISKEGYKSSSYDINVLVSKAKFQIDVADVTIAQTESGDIVAKVTDESGNLIKGVSVQFSRINSAGRATPWGSAVTNSEGIATLVRTVDEAISAGTYDILSVINGNDNYEGANATSKLIVKEKKVTFVGAKNYSVYYGNTVTYKIQIKDANSGAVLSDKTVTFKVNGKTKSVNTDKNGYASYSVKLAAGSYDITATCNGYSVTKKITFKPTLTAKNISKKKAKTTKFTVKLVNKNGKVLKNKKITFKLKNKKYTAKTNSKGVATLSLKNLKVGKYTLTSSYGGCTIKNTITIKK